MFLSKLIDCVYPNICAICGKNIKNNTYTCTNCSSILKYYKGKYTKKCETKYYDELLSLYEYEGIIKKRIWQFKFRECKYLVHFFADALSKKILELNITFDWILPVPISILRYWERGYNQSNLLAKRISSILKQKTDSHILVKSKHNKRQSELQKKDRRENVIGVYKVINATKIKDKVILLVDDVCTTGATLNECAKMLKKFGAKKVIAVTIAYVKNNF